MDNQTILITGATGNVGYETIRGLIELNTGHRVLAAVSNVEKAKKIFSEIADLGYRRLDFADPSTLDEAIEGVDVVFLLRPPQLADVQKYFEPLVKKMLEKRINSIVFLSVQGVENQKLIPHYKIEQLILQHKLDYIFLRPSYFMQNLTTTLLHEIKTQNKIFIPSGKLKFNWVDAKDIGLVGAHVLSDFNSYKNQELEVTGKEFKGFQEVADLLSQHLDREITYDSPGLFRFYKEKRKQGISNPMIMVMLMLHFLPRMGKNKKRLTGVVKTIANKDPETLNDFIKREIHKFK